MKPRQPRPRKGRGVPTPTADGRRKRPPRRDEKGERPQRPLLIQSDGKGFWFLAGIGGRHAMLVSGAPRDGAMLGSHS